MCNIQDALTFKNVNHSVIDHVENFVRIELPQIISQWKKSDKLKPGDDKDYFGDIYVNDPSSFKFVIGDRLQIMELVNHVKRIIDTNPKDGLKYFSPQKDSIKDAQESSSDLFQCVSAINDVSRAQALYLLDKLVSTSSRNVLREKGGYRYDCQLQNFAIAIRLLSGPLAYETLQRNLPCALPSLPSVNRYIHKSNCRVVEGVLRCNELLEYLEERNLEKAVHLCEDGTRTVERVQYDSYTNQIVGFALPLNKSNGLPIPFAFPAGSASEMIAHFEKNNSTSSLVNVIMAKPVGTNSTPPFCLLLFGTDNKYTAEDVSNRWDFIVAKLKKIGITVTSISSDSDPRYNAAMKKISKLGQKSETWTNLPWLSCGDRIDSFNEYFPICLQDTPHILTKLRNLFTKTKNCPDKLPFGKFFIKQSHLRKMIAWFSKDMHNLSPMVLDPTDRQNYESSCANL